jgi:hypothetical protein
MVNDITLHLVTTELFKNMQTPQGASYILAILDIDRKLAPQITQLLDDTGITRSRDGKIMLTSKGLDVMKAGGWLTYIENPDAFFEEEEEEEELDEVKAPPVDRWAIFRRNKKNKLKAAASFFFFF